MTASQSIFIHDENTYNVSAAREILPLVFNEFLPSSVLDIGCGLGTWLNVAKELGVPFILGIDGDYVDRLKLKIADDNFLAKDLNLPIDLQRRFGLVICLEVAEHLPIQSARILIESLVKHGDTILFSAAIPNQGGQNHVNEQWPEYWQELFALFGYSPFDILRSKIWENSKIEWWYRQNIVIYANKNSEIAKKNNPSKKVLTLIHPLLFNQKLEEISNKQKYISIF